MDGFCMFPKPDSRAPMRGEAAAIGRDGHLARQRELVGERRLALRKAIPLELFEDISLDDLCHARGAIELAALGRFDYQGKRSHLRNLESLARSGSDFLLDDVAFDEFSAAFRQEVINGADNPMLSLIGKMVLEMIQAHDLDVVANHRVGTARSANQRVLQAYLELVGILNDGDTAAAQRHWSLHLKVIGQYSGR